MVFMGYGTKLTAKACKPLGFFNIEIPFQEK